MNAAERRIVANIEPPPNFPPARTCVACIGGSVYLDYGLGRDAHEVVFGHRPVCEDSDREAAQ